MDVKDQGKTSSGLQANVAGLLCYLLGVITGIIFYLIEKDNKFVRFHAMQSIVVFGTLTVLNIVISFLMPMLGPLAVFVVPVVALVSLLGLVLWILLMVKAYQGELFKLPIAGDIAEKNS